MRKPPKKSRRGKKRGTARQLQAETLAEHQPAPTHTIQKAQILPRLAAAMLVLVGSAMALEAAAIFATAKEPQSQGSITGQAYHVGALVKAEPPRLQLAALLPPKPPAKRPSVEQRPTDEEPAIHVPDPPIQEPEYVPTPAILRLDPALQRLNRLRHKIHFTDATPETCLPRSLVSVLYDLAEAFGEVRVYSTNRSPRRNAQVGGARNSLHLQCRAIDFAVNGRARDIIKLLERHPKVGGIGRYPGSHYHIDNGPRRMW